MKNVVAARASSKFAFAASAFLLLLSNLPAFAQKTEMPENYINIKFPPLEEFKPSEPVIRTLKNGMKVYLMEDRELPLVRIRAMIRAGTSYEAAEKCGLASICSQVMRTGGTVKNPGDALDDALGSMAASIDLSMGGLSAGASASCLRESLPKIIELLADVLRNPSFPEGKIELAKSALRTGISRRNDQIGTMAQRAFQIAMFGKESVFAREPEYATVNAITRDDLAAYHNTYYRPDRVMLGVVGDFDVEAVAKWIETQFGDWKPSMAVPPKVELDPLPIQGRKVIFAAKDDVNQTNLYIGGLGVRRDDPDLPALRVGSYVLGAGGFSSRMMKKVRTELGLAYSVGAGIGAEYDRPGLFRAACQTKTQSTGQAIKAMLGEIEGILQNPPQDGEIAIAKDQLLNAEVFEYDTKPEVLARRMTLDYYDYPPTFLEDLNRRIREVTGAQIASALNRKLDPKNLTIVAVGRREGMDLPLENFGPVTVVDLSIPDPPAASRPAASVSDSAQAVAKIDAMFTKIGGREGWASVKSAGFDVSRTQSMQGMRMTAEVAETIALDGRSHAKIKINTPGGTMEATQVFTQKGGWQTVHTPEGAQTAEMPEAQFKIWLRTRKLEFTSLMQGLASRKLEVSSMPNGSIGVFDGASEICKLKIDAQTGLPSEIEFVSAEGTAATRTYGDFRKTAAGPLFPFTMKTKDGKADPEATFTKVDLNVAVDDSLFARPSGGK